MSLRFCKFFTIMLVFSGFFLSVGIQSGYCQDLQTNSLIFQELTRRAQLQGEFDSDYSLFIRNFEFRGIPYWDSLGAERNLRFLENSDSIAFKYLPVFSITQFNSKRPWGWADGAIAPNVGLQQYLSSGIFGNYKFIHYQFQPEIVIAQNKAYFGFSENWDDEVTRLRFNDFNYGDFPERFGASPTTRFFLGQTKLTAKFGAFESGFSTQNIWWGPGQWNSLIFSNNGPGFFHFTFNTSKPAKTAIGNFEGQFIIGRLENSKIFPTQFQSEHDKFFRPFVDDWRYLNGLSISYNPKWLKGFFFGLNRTVQQYNDSRGNRFLDFFPVFEPFQKTRAGLDRDEEGKDQQVSVFFRLINQQFKAEIYGEFGRRDHALNWREFILNPEHARAYILGFNKLIDVGKGNGEFIQLRGEITHQQESVNRYIRYPGLAGGLIWHSHTRARGFVHRGQPLGVGIGAGSNIQTFEVSYVKGFDKVGILLERLENQQDFYYRSLAYEQNSTPWIDLSVGLVFSKKWNNLILNSRMQIVQAHHYQWGFGDTERGDFEGTNNVFSSHFQANMIYLIRRKNK